MRDTAELAAKVDADVVVGFSIGASVASEVVASGPFAGPVVLLGISLSAADEPAFARAIMRLGDVLGVLPVSLMAKGAASMVRRLPLFAERRAAVRNDVANNDPSEVRHSLREYLRWLHRHEDPAARLCRAGVPA